MTTTQMTRSELNNLVVAIISTLDEVDYAIESTLYLGLGSDLSKWETVKTVLLAGNLVTISNYQVRLTEAGKVMAVKIKQFIPQQA
jgi:hypothetical protein